jgi:hypothetical protein
VTAPAGPEPVTPDEAALDARAAHRAESIAEFVYGTTAVIISLSGLEIVGSVPPEAAAAVTLAGAAAMWLSHAYARYLGGHVAHGQGRAPLGIVRSLRLSAPIVLAAVPASLLLAGAVLGFWSARVAIFGANLLAIVVLGVAGWTGARAADRSLPVSLGWAAMTASIGIGIVLLESLLHH